MQFKHAPAGVFDDPTLVSAAGLVPVLRLAQSPGSRSSLGTRLCVRACGEETADPSRGVRGPSRHHGVLPEGLQRKRHATRLARPDAWT